MNKAMKNKLAEKILEDTFISSGSFLDVDYIDLYVDAMQAYHEAKKRESKITESFERENQYVTDDDIETYARWAVKTNKGSLSPLVEAGIVLGAKAMRNGEIKHIKK